VLVASLYSRDIDLFPVYWDVVGLEDGLDRFRNFSTDTITCFRMSVMFNPNCVVLSLTRDERDGIFSSKLRWLEDIAVHGRHCFGTSLNTALTIVSQVSDSLLAPCCMLEGMGEAPTPRRTFYKH
jgi:hypothetical protein